MAPSGPDLYWLPAPDRWKESVANFQKEPSSALAHFAVLARHNLDFVQTSALDRVLLKAMGKHKFDRPQPTARLAILGSSTTTHLNAGIRLAGLRRDMWIEIYDGGYGQYWQEISTPNSLLAAFAPTTVLLMLDAHHVAASIDAGCTRGQCEEILADTIERIKRGWGHLQQQYKCQVVHQMPLPLFDDVIGNNEHLFAGSKVEFLFRLSADIREISKQEGVELLSLDRRAARDGLRAWHDPLLWLRAKQEISPRASPMFGELLVRIIAAKQGRSAKCLVLDLDNTLWGGEIGEVGPEGIALGLGSTLGEAYLDFQKYLLDLSRRGVILTVCSKNEHSNAMAIFNTHPEMVLKPEYISSFKVNWEDKPNNLRDMAHELEIGLDSFVFFDDSPFERALMRDTLPEVSTPELPEDPALFPRLLADSGYFESLSVTEDDRNRTRAYQANHWRKALRERTDLTSYLEELGMKLSWRSFAREDLGRIAQLIIKTNQFNLTTRRYGMQDLLALMTDDNVLTFQFRLQDRFGDNGLIASVIARRKPEQALYIDTFLMSCRVLGRNVEHAIINLIAREALRLGYARLAGEYIPTPRNGIVKDIYRELRFTDAEPGTLGSSNFELELDRFREHVVPIAILGAGA